jgi:hypothetical protein
MVEEVDRVNALVAPRSLTLEEGVKAVEVDLASPAEVNGVLVAALTRLGGTTLFGIKVDGDAVVVAVKTLTGPEAVLAIAKVTQRA